MPPTSMFQGASPNRAGVWDWRSQFTVVDPTDKEVISFALWEKQNYVSGTTTTLTFFAAGSTGQNGNLPGQGQLPAGWFMRVQAIRLGVYVQPTQGAIATAADVALVGAYNDTLRLITNGTARVNIGDKQYGKWPIWMLPGGGGVFGGNVVSSVATATTEAIASWGSNGAPDPRAVYSLPINIGIPPQYNFTLTLEWATALTLNAASIATNVPQVFAVFDGQLMRPKQ